MTTRRFSPPLILVAGFLLLPLFGARPAEGKPEIRDAFFAVYPEAIGTVLDDVPSNSNHCGVCHWKFNGGGARNPFGVRVGEVIGGFPDTDQGRQDAIRSIENEDPDADGYNSLTEITDTVNFSNTPTFPGLTPGNVGNVLQVDIADIQDHLVPTVGGDDIPPEVTVIQPNGGETIVANGPSSILWTATDNVAVAGIDLLVSIDGGLTFSPVETGYPNTGSYDWFAPNRPTDQALFRVVAYDTSFNTAFDDSDAPFTVASPPGGLVPTTLRDFDQPGTQPLEGGTLNPPEACAVCHGDYDPAVEPSFNWKGSMMAQASLDLLFEACLAVANQDAPDSGDLCLRCHIARGWLDGRSVPTDGSRMESTDMSGVSCDLCHRLVDPIYAAENPPVDQAILTSLLFPPTEFGNGMFVVDPTGERRGPFVDANAGHPILVSPFHREAALCGTCHDVSNPAFEKDGNGNYVPNAFDAKAPDFSAHTLMPIERTYSEWFHSAYNTPQGVYAPQFGGNKDYVSICQDCHMRDVTGQGCNFGTVPVRTDLPLHDMTGGSTWLPGLLGGLYPGQVDEAALQAGIARAQYMLQNAATLEVVQNGDTLEVTVTNETGHKLPTGYPEGRRMWLHVRFYDEGMNLLSESAAYDPVTGVLEHDAEARIYEAKPGLDEVTAPIVGVPVGPSFHFVLNNKIFKDNRIPPRGFTNAGFAVFGGTPVGAAYADGQYWDLAQYAIPFGAASAEVTLYYQSTSKEYVEFLRDENGTNTKGDELYDLWNQNGKCPPEAMRTASLALEGICPPPVPALLSATPGNEQVTLVWSDEHGGDSAVTGYRVYHDVAGEAEFVAEVGLVTEYTETGLENGTLVCYKVTALYSDCESDFSNVKCATPVPGPEFTVRIGALVTGEYRTGGIFAGHEIFRPSSVFFPGQEIAIVCAIEDGNGDPVLAGVAEIRIEGPKTVNLTTTPSDTAGEAEARWTTTVGTAGNTGPTPAGVYLVRVVGLDAPGYYWDGVEASAFLEIH